jgi:hypothetical protein
MDEKLKQVRYENITTMLRYHNDNMLGAFNRFVTLSIGIVGGSFWLLSQKDISQPVKDAALASIPLLFWFLGISSLALIYSNWKSWYMFRKTESELLQLPELAPKCPKACKEQLIMAGIILLVCCYFTCFSPLDKLSISGLNIVSCVDG